MSAPLVDRIEDGPLWWLGRLLIPASHRRRACHERGHHRPALTDLGRTKTCPNCGTW